MRFSLLLGSLLLAGAAHAADVLPAPFKEIITADMKAPVQAADLEVVVLMSPERCTAKTKKWLGMTVSADSLSKLTAWGCQAFTEEAAKADREIPLHFLPEVPSPSATQTLAAYAGKLKGRRYVALIDWRIDIISQSNQACGYCKVELEVPMEMVVIDTQTSAVVWHSRQRNQGRYDGQHYDAKDAQWLGPLYVRFTLKPLLAHSAALDEAPVERTTAFVKDAAGAAALNPRANLVILNNYRMTDRGSNYVRDYDWTVTLESAEVKLAPKAAYTFSYHSYAALAVPPGKYTVRVGTDTKEEVTVGEQPVYLDLSRAMFLNGRNLKAISAAEFQAQAGDLVNGLVPEATAAGWQAKGRTLRWPQP